MVCFEIEKLSDRVTRIYGINREQMYLLTGNNQAALVDTGSGAGDLRGLVESLTSLPVIVLLTHGHVDHAMGAPQFETVYMSSRDWTIYRESSPVEVRKNYLAQSSKFSLVEESDFICQEDPERYRELCCGMTFDLGGLTVEAVACPGHSPGSMMFLLREEKTLISGDACAFFTMLQLPSSLGLSTYAHNLAEAQEYVRGKYSTVYMSHSRIKAPVTLLQEVLDACEDVKRGTDEKIPFGFMGSSGMVAKEYDHSSFARLDGKVGNLVYDPARIWE